MEQLIKLQVPSRTVMFVEGYVTWVYVPLM